VVAQDALEAGRERGQGGARALVTGVGLELDPDAIERLEGVSHHQQLRLDVGAAAPGAQVQPGPADLDHPVGGADVEEAAAADHLAAAGVTGRERSLTPGLGGLEGELEPAVEALAFVQVRQPSPDLRRLRRLPEFLAVLGAQRL
jgi:hypothetical protein